MRKGFLCGIFLLVFLFLFVPASSQATILIGFDPVSQTAPVGDSVTVDIFISGLGDGFAPSLSAFDLDVVYDPAVLSFSSYALGPYLGDTLLWEAFDDSWGLIASDRVDIAEVSFLLDSELDSLQPGKFTLASLTFDILAAGQSDLTLENVVLGDAFGGELVVDKIQNGVINPVPEPATLLLLGSGLAGLAGFRKKFRRKRAG
jgi:hypothetical protein